MNKTLSAEKYQLIHTKTVGNFSINPVHRSAISKLKGNITNKKILDIGCGNGELLFLLQQKGADIYGIDYDKKSVIEAQKRTNEYEKIKLQTLTEINHPGNFFDVIYCIGTIGYISLKDMGFFLDYIYRILKPGGSVIIRTSTKINMVGTTLLKIKNRNYQSNTNFYTTKEYQEIIKRTEFKIEYCYRSMDVDFSKLSFLKIILYKILSFFLSSTWIHLKK